MFGRLRTRAIALVAVVALLPLLILGALAIQRARSTVLAQVYASNRDHAERSAVVITGLVSRHRDTLRRLARAFAPTSRLSPAQMSRMLRDHRMDVPDLLQVDYVGADRVEIATGRSDGKTRSLATDDLVGRALQGEEPRSTVDFGEDRAPFLRLATPVRDAGRVVGAIVAAIDLTEMWREIDQIKVGKQGYARVVDEDGRLIAGGTGPLKRRIFSREKDMSGPIVAKVLGGEPEERGRMVTDGEDMLVVGWPIPGLGWALILEEPVSQALEAHRQFTLVIAVISTTLLGLAALAGYLGARTVVRPIEALRVRTGEIAQGLLDKRIELHSAEELDALAEAINQMCADLIRLQDDVRKKERIATLGRLAAGLAHDLKHPVRALQMNARLMLEHPDDPQVRRVFEQVVRREFQKLEQFLDDLKRVSRDEPMEIVRTPIDVSNMVGEFAHELQNGGAPSGIEVVYEDAAAGAQVVGSRDLLGRVLSNLASNAYEAMEGEGQLRLGTVVAEGRVEIRIADTGCGMPPERLSGLFNDFATTKRRGLGLGLAVCKKIVADHGGEIVVESEVGRGTHFRIRLPGA